MALHSGVEKKWNEDAQLYKPSPNKRPIRASGRCVKFLVSWAPSSIPAPTVVKFGMEESTFSGVALGGHMHKFEY